MADFEHPHPALRRAKPLLGTFVEITGVAAAGTPSDFLSGQMAEAFSLGFAAVREIESAMSFHDAASELSRINSSQGEWVEISPALQTVLTLADALHRESEGFFNVAVARPLISQGLLPGQGSDPHWDQLHGPAFELRRNSVRRLSEALIDLGGIAKGYAVDCAAAAIASLSPDFSGCVNAGGDLRFFGHAPREVLVRGGMDETPRLSRLRIHQAALATSTIRAAGNGSAHVNPVLHAFARTSRTVSIEAENCMVADALTKVALLAPSTVTARVCCQYRAILHTMESVMESPS